jgi:hypothetical protein
MRWPSNDQAGLVVRRSPSVIAERIECAADRPVKLQQMVMHAKQAFRNNLIEITLERKISTSFIQSTHALKSEYLRKGLQVRGQKTYAAACRIVNTWFLGSGIPAQAGMTSDP